MRPSRLATMAHAAASFMPAAMSMYPTLRRNRYRRVRQQTQRMRSTPYKSRPHVGMMHLPQNPDVGDLVKSLCFCFVSDEVCNSAHSGI
jgi:hypothetical protein